MGLGPTIAPRIANAMETKPRIPVLWLHGLECTCCSESFIRSAHPLVKDVILSMISLDYDDTIMASAGHEAEAIVDETIEKHRGNYILACEGNPGLDEDKTGGMSCIIGGKPYTEQLRQSGQGCHGHHFLGVVRILRFVSRPPDRTRRGRHPFTRCPTSAMHPSSRCPVVRRSPKS